MRVFLQHLRRMCQFLVLIIVAVVMRRSLQLPDKNNEEDYSGSINYDFWSYIIMLSKNNPSLAVDQIRRVVLIIAAAAAVALFLLTSERPLLMMRVDTADS